MSTDDDRLEDHAAVIAALTALPHDASPRDVALTRELALDAVVRRRARPAAARVSTAAPISLRITDALGTHTRTFAVAQVLIGRTMSCHLLTPLSHPIHAIIARRGPDVWLMNLTDEPLQLQVQHARCEQCDMTEQFVDTSAPMRVGDRVTFPGLTVQLIEP